MKAKLYSNFVKSGTLTGGKMEEVDEGDSGFVEDKVRCFLVSSSGCLFVSSASITEVIFRIFLSCAHSQMRSL